MTALLLFDQLRYDIGYIYIKYEWTGCMHRLMTSIYSMEALTQNNVMEKRKRKSYRYSTGWMIVAQWRNKI